MQLELKESNSPFWLLGLSNGKETLGSATNIPCYYKTSKKQYEIATNIIKEPGIDEVYLITGVQWDNMKGSWSAKESGSYIQNKGKLIVSKNEITPYEEKYAELKEDKYPKGISRDPLPKKGVKTYTSVATALEDKGDEKMKLELNTDIIKEDVDTIPEILQDRFFNTMANGKPEEFKKFTKEELVQFAEFVKELPNNEVTELERSLLLYAISMAHGDDFTVESVIESTTQELIDKYEIDIDALKSDGYDLVVFRCHDCAEDLKEYNPYVYDDGSEIPLDKIKVIEVEEHDIDCENAEDNIYADPQRMVPIQLFKYSKIGVVKEAVPVKAIVAGIMYTVDNWDTLKDIIETIKSTSTELYNKAMNIYEYLKNKNTDIKQASKEIGDLLVTNESVTLKESKIVTPVGNPQTASSFVNIDIDLDHMEVSDFIVRLAQAIRSEQTSVLEYVALRSANGITNEERANIDAIIEEEKNHMVAFTTMLYKQILTNHKQNVDGASEEFTLPTFGMEIFDNTKDGKLTESIASTVEKLALKEVGIRMSDDYYIGNNNDGRMYHGLSQALTAVKNIISTSGEEVVVRNVTLADSINENVKLEDTFNSIDELINELKTDNNYDEIAYHIHEYAKTNKARALELMDKLFELERDKSPQECRDVLIAELETENKQYKTEETKVSLDGETMSQTQWDVVIDVDYDEDFHLQVLNNLTNAIEELNKITISEHYGIATDKYTLGAGKFNFVVITKNAFTGNINEAFVESLCDKLFERASTYEYYIKRA